MCYSITSDYRYIFIPYDYYIYVNMKLYTIVYITFNYK